MGLHKGLRGRCTYICIKQHVHMLYGVISRTVTVYICTELVLMFIINVHCIVLHGAKFSPSVPMNLNNIKYIYIYRATHLIGHNSLWKILAYYPFGLISNSVLNIQYTVILSSGDLELSIL